MDLGISLVLENVEMGKIVWAKWLRVRNVKNPLALIGQTGRVSANVLQVAEVVNRERLENVWAAQIVRENLHLTNRVILMYV